MPNVVSRMEAVMAGIDDQDRHGHPNFGIKPDPLPLDRLLDVPPGQPISRILIDQNAIPTKDMVFALGEADRLGAPLEHVLRSEGLADQDDILLAHATHLGALLLRRDISPPDPNCAALLSPEFCLTHSVLPWRFDGKHIILATAHPENFDKVCAFLPEEIGPVRMALCSEEDIHADIAARHGAYLTRQAETVAPADTSCRDIGTGIRQQPHRRRCRRIGGLHRIGLIPELRLRHRFGIGAVFFNGFTGLAPVRMDRIHTRTGCHARSSGAN